MSPVFKECRHPPVRLEPGKQQSLEPARPQLNQALPVCPQPNVSLLVLTNGADGVGNEAIFLGKMRRRSRRGDDEEPVDLGTHPNPGTGVLVDSPGTTSHLGNGYTPNDGVFPAPEHLSVANQNCGSIPSRTEPAESIGYRMLKRGMDPTVTIPMTKKAILSDPDCPVRIDVPEISAARNARGIGQRIRFFALGPLHVAIKRGHGHDACSVREGPGKLIYRGGPMCHGGPTSFLEEGQSLKHAHPQSAGLVGV